MKFEIAKYCTAILSEYQGNPLIEALPEKICDQDIVQKLSYYPDYDPKTRNHSVEQRTEYLTRITHLRQPLPEYISCFRFMETAIKEGYLSKNPLNPITHNFLQYPILSAPTIEQKIGSFTPNGCGITIVGESGVGKSCMLNQILHCFPQVIQHRSYNNKCLSFQQVVWIKVDCPHDSSVRGLCHSIIAELDDACSTKTNPAKNIAGLLDQIEAKIKSSFLGILVIDEMQNLKIAKTGGEQNLLRFLHSLVNNIGVPIVFCGNPPLDQILSKEIKSARRAENGGFIEMNHLKYDGLWDLVLEPLWELQWTNVETPLITDLSKKLHTLSVGNLDVAVRIYKQSQNIVIGTGDERITITVLDEAYRRTCQLTDPNLSILRRNSIKTHFTDKTTTNSHDDQNDRKLPKSKSIIADLSRIQHPEFSKRYNELQSHDDLLDMIVDVDLCRRALYEDNITDYFKKMSLLCDDPLTQLD